MIRGEECERGWRGRETDIDWLGNKRIEAVEMEEGQREREREMDQDRIHKTKKDWLKEE